MAIRKLLSLRVAFLLVSFISLGSCYGKSLRVKEIIYLPTDRAATDNKTMALDKNGEVCAIVKFPFPRVDESVISGDQIFKKEYHGNEWYIYMPPETFIFYIKYPGYDDLVIDLSKQFPDGVEAGKTYKVIVPYDDDIKSVPDRMTDTYNTTRNKDASVIAVNNNSSSYSKDGFGNIPKVPLLKKNCVYFQAGYVLLGISGLNIGVGGYISNINLEGNFQMGLSKSEDIYWKDISGSSVPVNADYSPMAIDFRLGYGVTMGKRFRLTPRLGFNYVVLKESADNKVADNSNAMGLPLGIKFELAFIKHFALSVEPSYLINLSKSDGYKMLSGISDNINSYSNGFGININLNCNF